MMLSSSTVLYTSFLTISSHFSKCCFATCDGFSQIASHISKFNGKYHNLSANRICTTAAHLKALATIPYFK